MKNKFLSILSVLLITSLIACSQSESPNKKHTTEAVEKSQPEKKLSVFSKKQHNYGGWYCPDNLNGFPAINIQDWKSVPVVNGRLATKEETQNGTSLIFVDTKEYPHAQPLNMEMPRLAKFYNRNSGKNETIIVIQALNVSRDSIVGFRYLNGGNGTAKLNEVTFLTENEIEKIAPASFVALDIKINATQKAIWEVITGEEYSKTLHPIFDKEKTLTKDWKQSSKINFIYPRSGRITSSFADNLFGNQYAQIDFESEDAQYVQKFLLLEDDSTNTTELQIVCGPYGDDFEAQKNILFNWVLKVRDLSEIEMQ